SEIVKIIDESIEEIEGSDDSTTEKLEQEALVRIKDIIDQKEEKEEKEVSTSPEDTSVSREFKNALESANSYLEYTSFSKEGLYDQLLYEGFPEDAAQYAVDSVNTDWNENALQTANDYLDYSSFSDSGLYDQLIYEGYTPEQAQYAIDNLD